MNGDEATAHLLGAAEFQLGLALEKLREAPPPDRLIAGWLLPQPHRDEAKVIAEAVVAQWRAGTQTGAPRSYQAVGSLGLAILLGNEGLEVRKAFMDGLDWALGTSTSVDGVAVGLAADASAVLAVVNAILRVGDEGRRESVRAWLRSVTGKFGEHLGVWDRAQLHQAARLLGEPFPLPRELEEISCVVRVALAREGEPVARADAPMVVAAVLDQSARVDAIGAVFLMAALARTKATAVRSVRADTMSVEDVLALLRAIPRSLREWTWEAERRTKKSEARQWHIDHEYHVQNLLWAVLAPLFVDLEAEDYGKKVGLLQPRADLTIPSLKLVIEAKFVRATESLKETQRQLAQDAALYFPKGSIYESMIAFVWDDASRTEQHATFIRGLEALEHVAGVVVLPRPAKMRDASGSVDSSARRARRSPASKAKNVRARRSTTVAPSADGIDGDANGEAK